MRREPTNVTIVVIENKKKKMDGDHDHSWGLVRNRSGTPVPGTFRGDQVPIKKYGHLGSGKKKYGPFLISFSRRNIVFLQKSP